MKILSLVWFKIFPARYGGQKGIAHFEEQLAQLIPVTCLCSIDNDKPVTGQLNVKPLLPTGKGQFFSMNAFRIIWNEIKKEQPNIILLEHPYYFPVAFLAKKIFKTKIVLHEHNIEYDRFRQLQKKGWPLLKQLEKTACRNADLILFKTRSDQQLAQDAFKIKKDKCVIVPYGIQGHNLNPESKSRICRRHNIPESYKLILFAGTLDYAPNADALVNIYKKLLLLLPKKEYKILVCGRNKLPEFAYLKELNSEHIIQLGEVEAIEPYFEGADVFIDPVLTGGGIQTKIIDALSYHLSVVCFDRLAEDIPKDIYGDKLNIIPLNNWQQFANKIDQALDERKKSTPPSFFTFFDEQAIAQKVADKIAGLK